MKDNQETLRKQLAHGIKIGQPLDQFESEWECAHDRIEKRIYDVFDAQPCLRKFPEWKAIKQMIRVHRVREIKGGNTSVEEPIYVCNDLLTARNYATYIRDHWLIENGLNYVKDVSFSEDASKRHINPTIFSTCISLALNIIRKNFNFNSKKSPSIRGILIENAIKIDAVFKLST